MGSCDWILAQKPEQLNGKPLLSLAALIKISLSWSSPSSPHPPFAFWMERKLRSKRNWGPRRKGTWPPEWCHRAGSSPPNSCHQRYWSEQETNLFWVKPCSSDDGARGQEPACQYRRPKRLRFHPWVWKIPWRRAWKPTPVFVPGNPTGRGAWWATVRRVAKSWAQPKHAHTHVVVVIIALATVTNTENKNVPGWKERWVLRFSMVYSVPST